MSASDRARLNDGKYLVGHWPLNGHVKDVSGHGRHGTWSGTSGYQSGSFGHDVGKLSQASLTWITATPGDSFAALTTWSASAWFTTTALGVNNQSLVGGADTFWLLCGTAGLGNIYFKYAPHAYYTTILPNIPYHMVSVGNGTSLTGYLNGRLAQVFTMSPGSANWSSVRMGRFFSPYTDYLEGTLSNVRLYSTDITGNEVFELYVSHS